MLSWKTNWEETRQHFVDWWNREGLVLSAWARHPSEHPHEACAPPPSPASPRDAYTQPGQRALRNHYRLSRSAFPADLLPISDTDVGPGSLALFLGSQPGFSDTTVWFEPCWKDVTDLERLPPLHFDPDNRWWRLTEDTLRACAAQADGKYMVGCPDLVENIDILAALRDPQTLLFDLVERPEWIEARLNEIHQAWCEAYSRIHDIIKLPDGSSCFGAFRVWGPGRTAKVQCDASAMFSPDMFARFVVPTLTAQCAWLDHSLYHLDGTQALCHLDALLSIGELDAIEWTPQVGIESGGHPRWYPLYRKILEAGKSVQILNVGIGELVPLLDAIGGKGVYVLGGFKDVAEIERACALVEPFRK